MSWRAWRRAACAAEGATALCEVSEDADHVRRRMRVTQTRTAELYIQEVGGQRFVASLPARTRDRLGALAAHAPRLLEETVELLVGGSPAAFRPRDSGAGGIQRRAPVRRSSRVTALGGGTGPAPAHGRAEIQARVFG